MSARKGEMPGRRKERQREIAPPTPPPLPPKGKVGSAAQTRIRRTKEPLRSARKVEN